MASILTVNRYRRPLATVFIYIEQDEKRVLLNILVIKGFYYILAQRRPCAKTKNILGTLTSVVTKRCDCILAKSSNQEIRLHPSSVGHEFPPRNLGPGKGLNQQSIRSGAYRKENGTERSLPMALRKGG